MLQIKKYIKHLPAKPGKHAVPPDKTTDLYQSLSPGNPAEWQFSIQRAMAWCKPTACLYQEVKHKLKQPISENIKTNRGNKSTL
jgi:hypothetical protein